MFKCQSCKRRSEPKETCFIIYENKKKVYPGNHEGFEPKSEKKVCVRCANKKN